MVVAPDGLLYVSDLHHDRIVVFDDQGNYKREFGQQGLSRGDLWHVWDLAIEPDGAVLVLNERPATDRNVDSSAIEVKRFRNDREVAAAFLLGPGGEPIKVAEGIAIHPDGGFLVVDSGSGNVYRYDENWVFAGTFGYQGREGEQATVVVSHADQVWVLEQYTHRFRLLDKEGTEQLTFRRPGSMPGQVSFPVGMSFCPDNWMAVADLGNHRVVLFDLDGNHVRTWTPPPKGRHMPLQVMDVAVSGDCQRVWVADGKGDRVLALGTDGEVELTIDRW